MKLDFLFNFPLGENSASFSLGAPNVNDRGHLFRIGIMEENTDIIKWLAPGWARYGETQNLRGFVKKGDTVVVEKKNEESDATTSRISINSREKWPVQADGGSSVNLGFTF